MADDSFYQTGAGTQHPDFGPPSQPTDSDVFKGVQVEHALRPVVVRQMLEAQRVHSEANFVIDGVEVKRVMVVAEIITIDRDHPMQNVFYLEDSTRGRIVARQWLSGEEDNSNDEFREHTYVRVIGELRSRDRNSRNSLVVQFIRTVVDFHEVYFHLLDVMVTTLTFERGPPPRNTSQLETQVQSTAVPRSDEFDIPQSSVPVATMGQHVDHELIGTRESDHDDVAEPPLLPSQPSRPASPSFDRAGASPIAPPVMELPFPSPVKLKPKRDPYSWMTALQRDMVLYISEAGPPQSLYPHLQMRQDDWDGVHVTDMALSMRIHRHATREDFSVHRNALQFLEEAGYIYTTVDDSHFKLTPINVGGHEVGHVTSSTDFLITTLNRKFGREIMTFWYSSWLPSLPSIEFALPSSIQRRFISFVLRKSLGHLLKPGQLDVHQIDTQIGSGYVQVRDLELDNEAINTLISGLPIELHDGSISSVTALIPWPNPLTSNVGFSLDSLHLTFHLLPTVPDVSPAANVNLADSVASVADLFIHNELTPREEATLRETFTADLASSVYSSAEDAQHNIPGSMDPFLSATEDEDFHSEVDPAGVSIFATLIERLLARFEFDAVDTKFTLIHPGHSSFTVSIPEIHYHTEARKTEDSPQGDKGTLNSQGGEESRPGQTRTVSISGVTLATRNLRPPIYHSPSSLTPSTLSPVSPTASVRMPSSHPSSRSISPSPSSSSSMDEDAQFAMSQSLVSLPPRPPSPASSLSSSLYQSAISTAGDGMKHRSQSRSRTPSPTGGVAETTHEKSHPELSSSTKTESKDESSCEEETVLSFGLEPIVIRLITSPPGEPPLSSGIQPFRLDGNVPHRDSEKLQISVVTGVIACALRASHVRASLDLLDAWNSHHPPPVVTELDDPSSALPTSAGSTALILGLGIEANFGVRGVVLILLPSSAAQSISGVTPDPLIGFFQRPLAPPRLKYGYSRVHLESMSLLLSLCSSSPSITGEQTLTSPNSNTTTAMLTFSLTEISILAFHAAPMRSHVTDEQNVAELLVSPILITDPHLFTQYPSSHLGLDPSTFRSDQQQPQLPTFNIVDWTDERNQRNGIKISAWRTKLKPKPSKLEHLRRDSQIRMGDAPSGSCVDGEATPEPSNAPAVYATAKKVVSSSEKQGKDHNVEEVIINITPLHIFVDLTSSDAVLSFVEDALGTASKDNTTGESPLVDEENSDSENHSDEEGGNTPPASPGARGRERERRRLERLVLEDLDLDLDYRPERLKSATAPRLQAKKVKRKNRAHGHDARTNVVVKLAMVRIQAWCPPPPARSRRSGAFVVDLHETRLTSGRPPDRKPVTRFADSETRTNEDYGPNVLLTADCRNIVVACSPVGDNKAVAFLALGPLISVSDNTAAGRITGSPPLRPLIVLINAPSTSPIPLTHSTFALTVDIPSVHVDLSKPVLDRLQYLADDVAQLVERTFGGADGETEKADSRDPSLIGSRFFAKSRHSGSESGSRLSAGRAQDGGETVIKIAVSEAFIRVMPPRKEESPDERPFRIFASDVDVLMELKPEGMDQTVLTVGITDLNITDTSRSGSTTSFLSLTAPRSLTSSPKSLLKLRFVSLTVPETTVKESRLKLTLWGFTFNLFPNFNWIAELGDFVKAPPGAFESVIPNERTRISLKIMEGSVRVLAPTQPGALVFHIGDLDFSTDIVGNSQEFIFNLLVPDASVLFVDNLAVDGIQDERPHPITSGGIAHWKGAGYALLAEIAELDMKFKSNTTAKPDDTRVVADRMGLRLHLCADTLAAVAAFSGDFASIFKPSLDDQPPKPKKGPSTISQQPTLRRGIMSSVDEYAFKRIPEVGPPPDMIYDDLPTNLDYLDESFGTAAGLRELRDDDLDEFDTEDDVCPLTPDLGAQQTGVISKVGGETIKILRPEGIHIIENFFDTLPPDSGAENSEFGETTLRLRIHNCDVTLFLYDGYDWVITRKTIEKEVKEMRRKLAKIKQLVATGQTQDSSVEETSALLFNSVYIGLKQDVDELDPDALIAAIDEELNDDLETISQSSWQSLKPSSAEKTRTRSTRIHGKRLTRSLAPSIEFRLSGVDAEIDQYRPDESLVSRTFTTVRDIEIFDHIKTSTWKKFLTELRSDSRGNVRETDSNMVRVELRSVRPVPGHPSEEARLRAKILPLRLYVDQDALDFLKKFFSFKDPHDESAPSNDSTDDAIFFQFAEVFPVDLKLDYKPRRVDYRALREGRTIELMNFFHFDGAEMTLRHITLAGITGWPRFFDMLNDLWTPDVKATQLVEVISGVSPIRSVVNVGSGLADLVLLPIAQYKKDGRIVRGVQKGTTAFVKSTAMEAIKLGARLATGTQVILEQAEGVLGGQFKHAITAETLQMPFAGDEFVQQTSDDDETIDLISKYAQQPMDVREGVHSAYRSLQKNFSSAAQTILAVPMEVYERSGNEGPVRAVIRAVPIAVLKPMIGASEAVSKTLLGLHNSLDPNVRHDNEAKYKYR